MRTDTSYFKTFSKMMWMVALLLVVFTAGCDRDHGGLLLPGGDAGPAGAVDLGTAGTYGIIAYNTITSSGTNDHIYGDVALIASDSMTGFALTGLPLTPASTKVDGQINTLSYGNPAAAVQAQADLNAAYLDLSSRPAPATVLTTPATAAGVSGGTFSTGVVNLSGFVLSPGIYATSGGNAGTDTYSLDNSAGPLVLDGEGNSSAVFIFQTFAMTTTNGSVVLRNGARAANVYWVVTTATVIGQSANTFFQGTVVGGGTITVGAGLTGYTEVQGRMLAGALGAGSITTNDSVIAVPAP